MNQRLHCLFALFGLCHAYEFAANHAWDFPSTITLRGGVLHAPPFASVEETESGFVFGGFQVDLLERMAVFAAEENVTLKIEMSPSPPQFGPAFDMVANDCIMTENNYTLEDCNKFDFIIANYYATAERGMRAHLSPTWLKSSIATIKYLDKKTLPDYTTMAQVSEVGATVCLKDGTFYAGVVRAKFPNATYFGCPGTDECILALKNESCVLYASDELGHRYAQAMDPTLEVTREQFNTQYIVWPFSYNLPVITQLLMDKWVRAAITNATMDELYFKYFQKALCPVGTAGKDCELPCDPDHGQADARGVCVCQSNKYTGPDCSIEVPEELNLIPGFMNIVAFTMFAINLVTILVCGGWLYWQRDTAEVRVSQPFFLCMVLFGCLISTSTILVLGQEDEGDGPVPACMAIPWLYSVGFSVTFGTLFAKIRRVWMIFKNASNPNPETRKGIISVQETLGLIGSALFIDIVILTVWTIIDPLKWERTVISADQFGAPLESEGKCVSEHWKIFTSLIAALHFGLMAIACYLCYVSRDIPTRFSEGKYVSIAMISNLQIFIVGLPILVIIGSDPATSFFVRSVIIWMNDFVVVTLIFGNLMYSVHIQTTDKTDVKNLVGNAVQRYASTVGRPKSTMGKSNMNVSLLQSTASQSQMTSTQKRARFEDDDSDRSAPTSKSTPPECSQQQSQRDDVLRAKDSWAGFDLSMFVRDEEGGAPSGEEFNDENDDEDSNSSEENDTLPPMKSFTENRQDVLGDKTSWGGGTLSMIMRDDSTSHNDDDIVPQSNSIESKPVDVLGGKNSWAAGTLSMFMHDDSTNQEGSVGGHDELLFATGPSTEANPRVSVHAEDDVSV